VPTILEATGAPRRFNGIKQKPIEGVGMVYTFDKANTNAPSMRKTQYFEMVGNPGDDRDGGHGPGGVARPAAQDHRSELA